MPADASLGRSSAVAGTFVLDGRLFFDEYLIPELQEFCVAAQVVPLKNVMKDDPTKKGEPACISHAVSSAGGIPELSETEKAEFIEKNGQLPPKDAKDAYFKLEKKGPWRWEWYKKLHAPGSRSRVFHYDIRYSETPVYRKYVTESEVKVVVTREDVDGVPGMLIDVTNKFDHWEGYFSHEHFDWGSKEGTDKVLWGS